MLSNRALKLPSPKPSLPLRWISSKKIGPITSLVKICSSSSLSAPRWVAPSIRMRRAQLGDVLAVVGQALVDQVEIGVDGVLEHHAAGLHALDGAVDVGRAERDVLDALAAVEVQVFRDLALVVAALVDRDADLAAGAGHGLGLEAGQLAFDVEIAHLAEVEEALVELRPLLHAAAEDVVRQVVDLGQAVADRVGSTGWPAASSSGTKSTS